MNKKYWFAGVASDANGHGETDTNTAIHLKKHQLNFSKNMEN